MNLTDFIGYPKEEVIDIVKKNKLNYEIVCFDNLKSFDTELFVKFEYINNKVILYFDRFILNV